MVENAPETEGVLAAQVEQYKLFVEQTAAITAQRHSTNAVFVTLNSLLFASYGFVWEVDRIAETALLPIIVCVLAIVGMASCANWRKRVVDYKVLLSHRFSAIVGMEAALPFKPYLAEGRLFEARGPRSGLGFAKLEQYTPTMLSLLHLSVLGLMGWLLITKFAENDHRPFVCGYLALETPAYQARCAVASGVAASLVGPRGAQGVVDAIAPDA